MEPRSAYYSPFKRVILFGVTAFLTLIVFMPLIAEASLRILNLVYPLERPYSLRDTISGMLQISEGEILNGLTRFYRYKPNSEGTVYGYPFRVNRWGVRGSDFLERTQVGPEPFRIMVLGDSITAGFGVAEEDRYTNILERRLRERYPSRKIEVINLGVQGFETLQEVKMLRKMWSVVGPNLTVVGVSKEDSNITYDYYLPYKMPIPERVRPYVSHLLTFRLMEMPYDWLYRKMHHIPFQVDQEKRSLHLESRDWKVFEHSVQDIDNFVMAHTHEPPLAIYLFDTMAGKEWGYDQVRDTFLKDGFNWCEVLGNGYEPVSRFEEHPNERSHHAYADALFKTIVARHLISELPSQIVSE